MIEDEQALADVVCRGLVVAGRRATAMALPRYGRVELQPCAQPGVKAGARTGSASSIHASTRSGVGSSGNFDANGVHAVQQARPHVETAEHLLLQRV
nr:hypothetical protein OG409_37110 [Streptomyces sp. NBC_00974]